MIRFDDRAIDDLMSAMGRESELADEQLAYQDERFLFWLANDLRSGLDRDQRSRDERDAAEFARRALTRLKIRLTEKVPHKLRQLDLIRIVSEEKYE